MERLKKAFQRSVEDAIKTSTGIKTDVNQRWIGFKEVTIGSATEQVGYEKKEKIRKSWITEDTINKMDERRSWKNKNDEYGRQRYRQLNNELRREAAKAKEEWWSKECVELEELDSQRRSDLVYAKVAKITCKKKMISKNMGVMNSAGNTVTEPEEVR